MPVDFRNTVTVDAPWRDGTSDSRKVSGLRMLGDWVVVTVAVSAALPSIHCLHIFSRRSRCSLPFVASRSYRYTAGCYASHRVYYPAYHRYIRSGTYFGSPLLLASRSRAAPDCPNACSICSWPDTKDSITIYFCTVLRNI